MNSRAVAIVAVLFAGCGGASAEAPDRGGLAGVDRGDGDGAGASDAPADVTAAIESEQRALAELDARIAAADERGATDDAVALRGDRVARASFVADLQGCAAGASTCPQTLAEPAIPPTFDPATGDMTAAFAPSADRWPGAASSLARDACACRTATCASWILAELDAWERALGDDDAQAQPVTTARECATRRLGR